jgi:molecular chaperone GrpE
MHEHSAEVSEPTCVTVFRKGYRKGDRILRAAQVVVTDPE